MNMNAEVVPAKFIAPIMKMSPGVIIHRVKNGEWDQDANGKYFINNKRVKFFRIDFLQKHGFIDKPKPEKTVEQLLQEISKKLDAQINLLDIAVKAIISTQDPRQREAFLRILEEQKTAGAATPTD